MPEGRMMGRWIGVLTCALLVAAISAVSAASPATPSPAATPFDCPVTQPNGIQPPPGANVFGKGNGDYGNDVLWTSLWIWGEGAVNIPDDDHLQPDGRIVDMKWAWYRFVPGTLRITGRRLDAPAPPLESDTSGYGEIGFNASGITFPTVGCWEITGTVGDKGSLTFVVQVIYPKGFIPSGTPAASSTPIR
jgi:hypothetical protein